MCSADVTAVSLILPKTRDDVCVTLIPFVARALSNQCVSYDRKPITSDCIDWMIAGHAQLTVALDEVESGSILLIAARGEDHDVARDLLVAVAKDLARDYDARTLFWDGEEKPIKVRDFVSWLAEPWRHDTRTPKARARRLRARAMLLQPVHEVLDQMGLAPPPTSKSIFDPDQIEQIEIDMRRAKTAPLRLSAWSMSIATGLIAAPLAIPLVVHNLVRGEDVRSCALALGVAGCYASMAHVGLVPSLMFLT